MKSWWLRYSNLNSSSYIAWLGGPRDCMGRAIVWAARLWITLVFLQAAHISTDLSDIPTDPDKIAWLPFW